LKKSSTIIPKVGKNKMARWRELDGFNNVIQPPVKDVTAKNHPIKGKWNKEIFKTEKPVIIELGCGKGEYTVGLAKRFPENNYIGIDIKGARMWRGAKTANEQNLENVAFLRTKIEFISSFFDTDEADEIWITFPDPHPGLRNANKRLTSPGFLNSYSGFMKNRGVVHLKTDNTELFNYTKKIAADNNLNIIFATDDLYSGNIENDILYIRTHYENTFLNKGFKINYLSFRLDKEKCIYNGSQKRKDK
jgi:tRNA (guanine-N7-)-methyltransferase